MSNNADPLYEVAPDRFVAERDALAKRIRAEGDKEAAAAVKTLRRPSMPAWALNQVARRHPEVLQAAWDAADHLAGSPKGEKFREATEAWRSAVAKVVEKAGSVLAEVKKSDTAAAREAVAQTVYAAGADEEVRQLVSAGRLTTDIAPEGFGEMAFGGAAPSREEGDGADDSGAAAAAAARRETQETARVARAARDEADRLRRRATEAEEAAARAIEAASRARRLADEAAEKAAAAAEDAARAEAAAR